MHNNVKDILYSRIPFIKEKKKIYYRIQQFTISKMIAVELKIEMKIN